MTGPGERRTDALSDVPVPRRARRHRGGRGMATPVTPTDDGDFLLTAPEVARRTGFSTSSLYQYGTRSSVPQPEKLGSALRWRASTLRAWAEREAAAAAYADAETLAETADLFASTSPRRRARNLA